jgi:hypothetical protein
MVAFAETRSARSTMDPLSVRCIIAWIAQTLLVAHAVHLIEYGTTPAPPETHRSAGLVDLCDRVLAFVRMIRYLFIYDYFNRSYEDATRSRFQHSDSRPAGSSRDDARSVSPR